MLALGLCNLLGFSAARLAVALGSAFVQMRAEGGGPVALYAFRKSVGNLYPPFSGCKQQDSHEFLMFLLSWVELTGGCRCFKSHAK